MGGIDSVIPYEHWTCVPPSPPKNLAISSVPAFAEVSLSPVRFSN